MKKEETILNPKIKGEVELEKINFKQYNGYEGIIQGYEFKQHNEYGLYVIIKTLPIAKDEKTKKEIFASRVLGLVELEDGTFGWGSESATSRFMKKYDATTFDDLIGKKVIVNFEISKSGKEVLTF